VEHSLDLFDEKVILLKSISSSTYKFHAVRDSRIESSEIIPIQRAVYSAFVKIMIGSPWYPVEEATFPLRHGYIPGYHKHQIKAPKTPSQLTGLSTKSSGTTAYHPSQFHLYRQLIHPRAPRPCPQAHPAQPLYFLNTSSLTLLTLLADSPRSPRCLLLMLASLMSLRKSLVSVLSFRFLPSCPHIACAKVFPSSVPFSNIRLSSHRPVS